VDINKRNIIIGIGAFIVGVVFSLSIVLIALWAYRLGRSDYQLSNIKDAPQYNPTPVNTPVAVQLVTTPTPLQIITSVPSGSSPTQEQIVSTPTHMPNNTQVQIVYVSNTPAGTPAGSSSSTGQSNSTSPSIDPAMRQTVMDYMYKVNKILSANQLGGDPSQFAQQLIGTTLEGNASGFDKLIINYENTKNQMLSLNPPDECREYHEGSISIINMGIELLKEVKTGITSQDINQLLSVQSKASIIENEAKKIDNIGNSLLEKYNIPKPK
jgi:hypothetical protein